MSLAICAIFKNEAPYLREWIEFHMLVGVDRFYLYQNGSVDNWVSILQPYVRDGKVEITHWPYPAPCQLEAYQHFIDRRKGQPGWVAFIDCDEFLFSPNRPTITAALAEIASPAWGAVAVNWVCFGASHQEHRTDGLVLERFTMRPADNFPPNLHVKSIVRMDRVIAAGPDPHHFPVAGGTFTESGLEMAGPLSSQPSHTWLRINHYHTKSREEYLQRIARGKADSPGLRSAGEFDGYQSTDLTDTAIWRFLPALKQRLR